MGDLIQKNIYLMLTVILTTAVPSVVYGQNSVQNIVTPKIELPGLQDFKSPTDIAPGGNSGGAPIEFEALLFDGGAPIESGLIWRFFNSSEAQDGKLTLLAEQDGGSIAFALEPGEYFVHVAFGRAGVTKKLKISANEETPKQLFILDAGGLVLDAIAGTNVDLSNQQLNFAIYSGEDRNASDSDRQLVAENIKAGTMVRLNEGNYHIVSNYGNINAVSRADVEIQKGKLTELQMKHRAAEVSFKFVSRQNGEPIAETSWIIYSSTGDIIKEATEVQPNMVLSEGDYTAVAVYRKQEYSENFHVAPGKNSTVQVLLK